MIMTILHRSLTLLMAGLLVSACSVQPPVPEDHFYRLPAASLKAVLAPLANELAVKRFVTDGLHSERAMLYSEPDQPLSLKQYHYHYWNDAPPSMIQEHIIYSFRHAGVSKQVVNYDPARRSEYTLKGKIRRFEQINRGSSSSIVIDIELRLDNKSGDPVLIKDYSKELSTSSSAPHALVTAFAEALSAIYAEFIADWEKR
jgi:ABC-type uncharacterized transport system auxiliary subunit